MDENAAYALSLEREPRNMPAPQKQGWIGRRQSRVVHRKARPCWLLVADAADRVAFPSLGSPACGCNL